MSEKREWQIAERNGNGCISAAALGWTGAGTATITTYNREFEHVLDRLLPGCVCIDKAHLADDPSFVAWVFGAPLPTLGKPSAFDKDSHRDSLLLASGWGSMLAGAIEGSICLDTVGPDTLAAYWRERGARVGVYNGTEIVWE